MISDGDGKHESDAEKLCQMLDLKLAGERAAWKRAKSKHRTIRAVSFLFLFLLIAGALAAYFLVFSRAQEQRLNRSQSNSISDE